MRIPRRFAVVVAGFVLAAAAVVAVAPAASAHDSLVEASPGDGDAVTAPIDDVSLRFSGVLLGADTGGNVAVVTGPDGTFYETDCAAVDGTTLTLPVALGPAGTYLVDWRVVSSDGHPISGQYEFSYQPPTDAEADAGSSTHPCAGIEAPPEDATEDVGIDGGLLIGVTLGAVAVLTVAGVVVLILRSGRSR